MPYRVRLFVLLACVALPGCVARAAYDIASVPVRATSKVVDLTTTSPSEAARNRERAAGRREQELRKVRVAYVDNNRRCQQGDSAACRRAQADRARFQQLSPSLPAAQ